MPCERLKDWIIYCYIIILIITITFVYLYGCLLYLSIFTYMVIIFMYINRDSKCMISTFLSFHLQITIYRYIIIIIITTLLNYHQSRLYFLQSAKIIHKYFRILKYWISPKLEFNTMKCFKDKSHYIIIITFWIARIGRKKYLSIPTILIKNSVLY